MVTTAKTSIDTTQNSINNSAKMATSKLSRKSNSDLYNLDNIKTTSKAKTSKSEDFKEVLSSKTSSRDNDNEKIDDVNQNKSSVDDVNKNKSSIDDKDTTKVDELNEKLEELEEDSKSSSKDQVNDILAELMNLLKQFGIKEEDIKSNGLVNSDMLKTMLQGIDGNVASNNTLSSNMDKLMQLLKTDSAKDGLDNDSLKLMEKLLNNLSAKLTDDNTEAKSSIKNLMSEISNMLDNKQNQNGKALTLEEMLNKNNSQENKESSSKNQSNNDIASKNNKEVSKEDKFLSSLLDDNKDSSLNKINLFASRTATIQNQGVDTTGGLTINKATFINDLIKDVRFMSNNGLKELTVKVNPGNLGEITISLVQEDGIMKANLKANSKETTELLSQNLAEIKKQLSEQNIKVADVNIELYHEDTTFFSGQDFDSQLAQKQQKNTSKSNNEDAEINAEDKLTEDLQTISDGNINFLA